MPTLVPVIPESAPFTAEQRAWLNGYLAGLTSRGAFDPNFAGRVTPSPAASALKPLTILFGSQTGTAESLAKKAAKEAGQRGFAATVMDLAGYTAARLAQEKNILLITSTFGEGEPPDNAKALYAALAELVATSASESKRPLAGVRFSVCGLGDTNYVQFCQCAKDFDARLEKLGAGRVSARMDCDLDYEGKFTAWLDAALAALGSETVGACLQAIPSPPAIASKLAPTSAEPTYSKKNPFPALLLASRNLNAPGSGKQVHHVEFDLAGSGLVYEAGDALGVIAQNCPELVAEVLSALGCDGEEAVPAPDGRTVPLRRALTEFYELGKPSAELAALCSLVPAGDQATAPRPVPHHVVDLLLAAPGAKPSPPDFVRALRKLQVRLYSIASSPKAHPGQVHLTVGALCYEKNGRARKGVCSTFLADRARPGQSRVGVFVHPNQAFRPPASGDTPMIMVGPGTGIAPFRAFLEERRATGAQGKNWLFFGDQHAASNFLYRDELAALQRDGVLTRLDTAFSRDQPEKIYVQQRMLEHAAELFTWLEQGAHFYVCGDASRMAKDVDAALHQVIERAGGKSPAEAAACVAALKAAKRYARDVY